MPKREVPIINIFTKGCHYLIFTVKIVFLQFIKCNYTKLIEICLVIKNLGTLNFQNAQIMNGPIT